MDSRSSASDRTSANATSWRDATRGFITAQLEISRPAAVALFLLTLVLLVVNAALLGHNSRLKEGLARANRSFAPTVGSVVPPLLGIDLDGTARTLAYGGDRRATLLFVFSPDCPASARAWPRWLDLAQQADANAVRLVYANVGSPVPASHASRGGDLKAAAVIETDARSKIEYNLRLTPQILHITPEGRIANVWLGTLDADEELALRQALGIGRHQAASALRR